MEDTLGTGTPRSWRMPALVLLVAVALAAVKFDMFWDVARQRMCCIPHDRNAHYLLGLSLAADLHHGDFRQLFSDLDGARTWPPLHGILEGVVLFFGGPDYRLAVLPSLLAWVGTILFGYLTAARMVKSGGSFAGWLAALFIIASPAHRAFATDTMLESLGACLTLVCLYLYLVAVQDNSRRAWTLLALAMTALFLEKFNYWLLVLLALAAAELTRQPRLCLKVVHDAWRNLDIRSWLGKQLRHPLSYLLAGLGSALTYWFLRGPRSVALGGEELSMRSPHNLLTATYAVLFARVAWGWWKQRQEWANRLAPSLRTLLAWHVVPVAMWFLLPKRLGYWLLYINPSTNAGEVPQHDVMEGIHYYTVALIRDYHLSLWSAMLVLGLIALGLTSLKNLRRGSRAVVFLLVIAAVLMVPHPNRKSRFFHSWIAAGWVLAGAGAAAVMQPRTGRKGSYRPALAATIIVTATMAHTSGFVQLGHSAEQGHYLPSQDQPSLSVRDLTEYYLPFVAASRHAALLATTEMKYVARWSVLEEFGARDRLEVDIRNYGTSPEQNRRAFDNWVKTSQCDTLIFVDLPKGSYFDAPTAYNEPYSRLRGFLAEQTVFHVQEKRAFPKYGCNITIWKRN